MVLGRMQLGPQEASQKPQGFIYIPRSAGSRSDSQGIRNPDLLPKRPEA